MQYVRTDWPNAASVDMLSRILHRLIEIISVVAAENIISILRASNSLNSNNNNNEIKRFHYVQHDFGISSSISRISLWHTDHNAHFSRNNSQTKIALVENAFFPLLIVSRMSTGTTVKYDFFSWDWTVSIRKQKKKKEEEKTT